MKDLNVFNKPSLLEISKGFPMANLTLALLTTNDEVSFLKRSDFRGKLSLSPIIAQRAIKPFDILQIIGSLFCD